MNEQAPGIRTLDQDAFDRHLKEFSENAPVLEYSQQFRREGYVKLRGLVPEELFAEVTAEVNGLLDEHARRIDIELKETGNSPRKMHTVSAPDISRASQLIPAIYDSASIRDVLGQIAQADVLPCPWEGEKYVVIRQDKPGDTHGWHWGDFSYTLIWIIEAPGPEVGGMLQCVPHTNWDKQNPRVHEYLQSNPIRTYANATGDLYFLRSDTTLHRTIPLSKPATRIILNTCWASAADVARPTTHETMDAMFS
ncbi:HalD/BesD family halogenase [Streptomyces sp. LaBMicrA B280]|uniref:HalD/BesD family halogenase n=1 Tax=Streptomyces sp. LaBMicrA B280 TaxID=3391001 RepID=UPI003BA413CA